MTLAALVALSMFAALGGCDDDGGQYAKGEGASMVVSPTSVTFPQLQAGSNVTDYVTVRNEGTGTLTLPFAGYRMEPADAPFAFSWMNVGGEDTEKLDTSDEGVIAITYLAEDDLAHNAVLYLEAANGNKAEVYLATVKPSPLLGLSPSPLVFSGVAPGATEQKALTVTNVGTARLDLQSVSYLPENTTDFTIVSGLPEAASTLDVGASFEIIVEYRPSGDPLIVDEARMLFESDSGGQMGTTTVDIVGTLAGPRIEIEPAVVDFGALEHGQTETRSLLVSNIGEGTLEVHEIYIQLDSSPDFTYADVTQLTIANDGSTAKVDVSYSPTDGGIDSGFLVFESNDPLHPGIRIPLQGAWAGPDLVVRPTKLAFGQVAIGASKRLTFDIYNDGLLPLTINDIVETDFPTDGLTWAIADAFPIEIEALSKRTVTVTWAPAAEIPLTSSFLEVQSNDPEQPNETVEITYIGVANGTCDLRLVPTTLNFGLVPGGYNKQLPIMVKNEGAGSCRVKNVAVQTDFTNMFYGNPFKLATPFQGFTVDPGDTALVEIDYSPFSGDTDTFAAQALFYVDDVLNGTQNIACPSAPAGLPGQGCFSGFGTPGACWACLMGTTGDPALGTVPGVVDFGLVTLGCKSAPTGVRIYNKGTAPTNLLSVALDPSCASKFTLRGLPTFPHALAQGTFYEVELQYTPTSTAADSCRLIVTGETETMTIPVMGEGTTDENVTDEFDQLSGRKVDVLFVVDNSGSMGDDQTNLANNFGSFIAAALTWGVDFQIGVTTTDDAHGGHLQSRNGKPRIIQSMAMTAAAVEAAFKDNIKVGDTGSASERGLKGAELALSAPNATSDVPGDCPGSPNSAACAAPYSCDTHDQSCGGYNARFVRDDASLEVIFVSDEVDQSPSALSYYVDFFRNIKGYQNDSLFHAHAIIGDDSSGSCSTGGFGRYTDVAQQTAGRTEPLCGNFANGLANIGNNAFGLRVQFFLSRVPVVSSIKVAVDGSDRTSGWTFEAASNSIIFDSATVPQENAHIVVTYKAACF